MLEARHFIIFIDHKPINYAFQQKRDKCLPLQFNHLNFVAQFTTDINTFLDRTTLSSTPSLVSNLSLHHHSTLHWPHLRTAMTSSDHSWG
jgi:hypothetical protein